MHPDPMWIPIRTPIWVLLLAIYGSGSNLRGCNVRVSEVRSGSCWVDLSLFYTFLATLSSSVERVRIAPCPLRGNGCTRQPHAMQVGNLRQTCGQPRKATGPQAVNLAAAPHNKQHGSMDASGAHPGRPRRPIYGSMRAAAAHPGRHTRLHTKKQSGLRCHTKKPVSYTHLTLPTNREV